MFIVNVISNGATTYQFMSLNAKDAITEYNEMVAKGVGTVEINRSLSNGQTVPVNPTLDDYTRMKSEAALEALPDLTGVRVFDYWKAPEGLRCVAPNNDDRDYIIVYADNWDFGITDKLTVCDSIEENLDYGLTVAVTAHS